MGQAWDGRGREWDGMGRARVGRGRTRGRDDLHLCSNRLLATVSIATQDPNKEFLIFLSLFCVRQHTAPLVLAKFHHYLVELWKPQTKPSFDPPLAIDVTLSHEEKRFLKVSLMPSITVHQQCGRYDRQSRLAGDTHAKGIVGLSRSTYDYAI